MRLLGLGPAIVLFVATACTPTPRPQAVAAVIESESPVRTPVAAAPTQMTVEFIVEVTASPVGQASPTPTASSATASAAPSTTPTPDPELPPACSAAPPESVTIRDLGYQHSICRSPLVSPDGRWLAFAQLTESYTGDELWVVNRTTGNQTLVSDPTWTNESFRALGVFEWSGNNQLLIVHNLASGAAPASAFDPATGTLVNLGSISTLAWNGAHTAVVGWEFRAGCLFTRAVGYDFDSGRVLQSAAPEQEVVGRVFWMSDDGSFIYSRREIVGDCPGCYYRAAELVLAQVPDRVYTTLVSDPGFDYVLLGFRDGKVAVGERAYVYHTCEAPQVPPTEMKYYLLDPMTRELTAFGEP